LVRVANSGVSVGLAANQAGMFVLDELGHRNAPRNVKIDGLMISFSAV
jgi:hypothetical protein